jgi:hypothetical protein
MLREGRKLFRQSYFFHQAVSFSRTLAQINATPSTGGPLFIAKLR